MTRKTKSATQLNYVYTVAVVVIACVVALVQNSPVMNGIYHIMGIPQPGQQQQRDPKLWGSLFHSDSAHTAVILCSLVALTGMFSFLGVIFLAAVSDDDDVNAIL